ncbi:hypothetical protein PVAND_006021 [Polypedilum vanderplanki]|uniref:Odorant receptor n=1 Tax=Polypedilum vanderplanki TaxID=319348 RepID=A0A9J6C1W8_POLVA|nr:hypothetical protein PVAND_006021 [Polypedilum vanderplanki]
MNELASTKLQAFQIRHINFGQKIFGDENSIENKFPPRLIALVTFLMLVEITHFNGIYQKQTKFLEILISLVIYLVIIQLFAQFFNRIVRHDHIQFLEIHNLLIKFTKKEETNQNSRRKLISTLDLGEWSVRLFVILLFIVFNILTVTPIVISIIDQNYELSVLMVPFIESKSLFGYVLNITLAGISLNIFCAMILLADTVKLFYIIQTKAMVDIFIYKLTNLGAKLNVLIEEIGNEAGPSNQENRNQNKFVENLKERRLEKTEIQLIDLMKEYKFYDDYIETILSFLEFTTFVALSVNSIGIGLSILYSIFVNFIMGFSAFLILFSQILTPCILGTIVTHQNEKLLKAVCEFPWYNMSVKSQKIYLQFLHQCQTAAEINLKIIGVVNMELFTHIMNGSYSYLNFVMNFMKG